MGASLLTNFPLGAAIAAVGAIGTAAFGMVDASKTVFTFINRIGLGHLTRVVTGLTPDEEGKGGRDPVNTLRRRDILAAVEANWINGTDLDKQKCHTKELVLLHFTAENALPLARHVNVDPQVLQSIATKNAAGDTLSPTETVVQSDFNSIVTNLIDEAYERSDESFRNATRTLAAIIAILLAFGVGWALYPSNFWCGSNPWLALIAGLLATPLAPVAKDLSTTIAAFANALQAPKPKA